MNKGTEMTLHVPHSCRLGVLLMALTISLALARPLIPDHLPVGSTRPLEEGDRFTLVATRFFLAPSLADSSFMMGRNLKARVLGTSNQFYQLSLEREAGSATPPTAWVYRSELELIDLEKESPASRQLPVSMTTEAPQALPAAGDTLRPGSILLYAKPDLLSDHEQMPAGLALLVLAPENAEGFLKVRHADGRGGWLYRAELAEGQRRPR